MFQRSLLLTVALALVSVFFSSTSSAQSYYSYTTTGEPPKVCAVNARAAASFVANAAIANKSWLSDYRYGTYFHGTHHTAYVFNSQGHKMSVTIWSLGSCSGETPLTEDQASQNLDCPSGTFKEGSSCYPDDARNDSDGDGISNINDPDSDFYYPHFCTDNPDSQYCEVDTGDDNGGGDGNGDDGSGGGSSWNPDPSLECTSGYGTTSQACCTSYGEHYCPSNNKGGLVDAAFTNVGGASCSVTCDDDVIDPPDGGDDGSGGGDDGTGGDDGSTDTPDSSGIIDAINSASSANDNSLNDVQSAINDGFDQLDGRIVDFNNNMADGFNLTLGQLSGLNNTASGIADDVEGIEQNTSATNDLLNELNNNLFGEAPDTSDFGGAVDDSGGLVDPTALMDSKMDENNTASGIADDVEGIEQNTSATNDLLNELNNNLFGEAPDTSDFGGAVDDSGGLVDPTALMDSKMDDFVSRTGITGNEELETQVVDLGVNVDKFEPMLGGSSDQCPAPYTMNFLKRQWVIEWGPVCDAFDILRIFVITAAWLSCPFIILGVSKK